MKNEYIVRTNYFNQPWTWILRGVRFLIAMLFLYLIDLQELENGSNILVIGFIFAALLAIALLIWPTDELALDKDNIYFIRKSLWSELNRTIEYKISTFKGIGTYNMSKPAGIFALFVPVWDVYRVEIIFKDDSSLSRDLMIPKKELKKILLMVRKNIHTNG
jgi:hypothetical protein